MIYLPSKVLGWEERNEIVENYTLRDDREADDTTRCDDGEADDRKADDQRSWMTLREGNCY